MVVPHSVLANAAAKIELIDARRVFRNMRMAITESQITLWKSGWGWVFSA